MAEKNNVNQHLEMMIQKQNRCEDWVAAVALRKQNKKKKAKRKKCANTDYIEEYSNLSDNEESIKRRPRKLVSHAKSLLNLTCEWHECKFVTQNQRQEFWRHVLHHIPDLGIVKRPDESECYQCLWDSCNFQTANISEIKRHVSYHSYHTVLKASALELHNVWDFQYCKLDNENRNWLPDLSYPFECKMTDCDFIVDDFQLFLEHVNHHVFSLTFNEKTKLEVSCFWKGCTTFKCIKRTRMKIHMRRHTTEKMLACPTCGAMFTTNTKYMDHCIRKTPLKVESNRCQYCLRYFSSERLLRDHMRYHVNSYKCSFCDMTCPTPSSLANHVRYRHLNERPFKCSECSYRTVSAEDCNAHMSSHDTEPRYQCEADNCNYSCRSVNNFKKHFRLVHLMEPLPVYCCHLCDKKYNIGHRLGNHLRKVHKLERPSGHTRFRYMQNIDGFYRLQVERYESVELNNDVETQLSSVSKPKETYILRQEPTDEKFCQKYTLCVDEAGQTLGALIAIDVLDEQGNLIKTSTVREEYIGNVSNTDVSAIVDDPEEPSPNNLNDTETAATSEQNLPNTATENKSIVEYSSYNRESVVDVNQTNPRPDLQNNFHRNNSITQTQVNDRVDRTEEEKSKNFKSTNSKNVDKSLQNKTNTDVDFLRKIVTFKPKRRTAVFSDIENTGNKYVFTSDA